MYFEHTTLPDLNVGIVIHIVSTWDIGFYFIYSALRGEGQSNDKVGSQ